MSAVISKSPPNGVHAYWNASAVPQMSAPAPFIVYASPLSSRPSNVVEPALPTFPTSAPCQPFGSEFAFETIANRPESPTATSFVPCQADTVTCTLSLTGCGLLQVHSLVVGVTMHIVLPPPPP